VRRETALGGVAVLVALATVLSPLALPGVLADPGGDDAERDPVPPGEFAFEEVTVAPASVEGDRTTLTVDARLRHGLPDDASKSDNVTVLFRATDDDSGLVETSRTVDVGTVADRREVSVVANLTVPRESDYRIDVVVFRDGRRVADGYTTVGGVDTLVPEYARTSLSFERFERAQNVPTVAYSIEDVSDGRARLNVSAYLTNEGSEPTDDVSVRLIAFQSDSNVAADRTSLRVGSVRPGRTVEPSGTLTVPDDYNYRLTAFLISDGVVVDTVQSSANLAPEGNGSAPVNDTDGGDEDGFQAGDFDSDDEADDADADGTPVSAGTTEESAGGQPGFGAGLAALALAALLVAALARRDRR
jgi:hypothetical protein